jgi:hypothetical protein
VAPSLLDALRPAIGTVTVIGQAAKGKSRRQLGGDGIVGLDELADVGDHLLHDHPLERLGASF